jgi:hypothetical protein
VEHVRTLLADPLRVERRSLADSEAVLLVDDDDPESRERDRFLDQRMGADDLRQLAAGELPA